MSDQVGKLAALEALLFVHGEALSTGRIAKLLEISKDEVEMLASHLTQKLGEADRGLTLLRDSEKLQMVTKPELGNLINNFVKEELSEDLTPASLETLALVAYLGPVAKSRIDYIRGVNASFTIRSLMLRGLVERVEDQKRPSRFLYQPTFETLAHLGITKREELPEYERFQGIIKNFEAQIETQA